MRKYKVLVRLLVACFVCSLALKLIDDNSSVLSTHRAHRKRLLPTTLKDVNQVNLTLASGHKVLFEADEGGWRMTEPRNVRASAPAVQQLLDAFEQAPLLEYIDSEDTDLRKISSADFGFDNPVGEIVLKGPRSGIRLKVGDCDAVTNSLFISFENDKGVCVTTPALREFFLRSPLDYADRRVFQCDMRLVHTIVLRRPTLGDVKLVRDNTQQKQWKITQPFEARADWDAVGRLFKVLASATVIDDFQSAARVPVGGLDQREAPSITLFSKNDLAGQTLVLGDRVSGGADLTYALASDGILSVTGSIRRLVLASAHDFRDRRLFPAANSIVVQSLSVDVGESVLSLRRADSDWSLTAPVSDKAEPEEVAALIDAILSLRAERFAPFDAESAGPRLASATVTSKQKRLSFAIYGPTPDFPGRPGILPDGSDMLFLVPADTVSNILARCRDPRPLLSRTLLSVNEERIRAVTLSRPGAPAERIEENAGEWSAALPGRRVDQPTIRRFFTAAAEVRAESVAALAPTNALPLDGGSEIAFDLDDGAALRLILTIGPRLEAGHLATVKGHDAVFLLSPETASLLTRPFFTIDEDTPADPSPPPPATEPDSK